MSLEALYLELYRNAERTGEDRSLDLRGGARLALRVRAGVVTLNIMRKGKQLGDRELAVFREKCGVPADAQRWPVDGQGERAIGDVTWRYVAYVWREAE